MSLKEDPLAHVYYFKVVDWFQSKVLLSRFVCGFLLIIVMVIFPLGLYQVRNDKDLLLTNLMVTTATSPGLAYIIAYFITIADYNNLTIKANKNFRSITFEGAAIYDRITRSNRKVSLWIWSFLPMVFFVFIIVISYDELTSQYAVYHLVKGSRVLEGAVKILVFCVFTVVLIVITSQARWSYYIYVQMVLMEGSISRKLGGRISRDDKKEQELCRKRLREVVRFHSDIKSIANEFFENIVRVNMLLVFFPAVGLFAAILLFVFTEQSNGVKFLMGAFWMITLFSVQIVIMNIQSTIDQSEKLCEVLYDCPWYEWDKRNCRMLIMIISVLKEPLLKYQVYGIFELNRTVFLQMFRMSYAFLTTVLNTQ